jgi:hypothetical protein
MFFLNSIGWLWSTGPASARRVSPAPKVDSAASPPTASPEPRRKLRRSMVLAARPAATDARRPRAASPFLRFTSIGHSPFL